MDIPVELVIQALDNIATEEDVLVERWAAQQNLLQASIHHHGAQLLRKISERLSVIGGL